MKTLSRSATRATSCSHCHVVPHLYRLYPQIMNLTNPSSLNLFLVEYLVIACNSIGAKRTNYPRQRRPSALRWANIDPGKRLEEKGHTGAPHFLNLLSLSKSSCPQLCTNLSSHFFWVEISKKFLKV